MWLQAGNQIKTYMGSHPVVPEHDGVRLPSSADLTIDTAVDVVVEEVEDRIYQPACVSSLDNISISWPCPTRFFLLESDYAPCELPVHVQGLLSGDRMPAHDRMDVLDGVTADDTATLPRPREVCLGNARMDRLQRPQDRDELGRQPFQRRHL